MFSSVFYKLLYIATPRFFNRTFQFLLLASMRQRIRIPNVLFSDRTTVKNGTTNPMSSHYES